MNKCLDESYNLISDYSLCGLLTLVYANYDTVNRMSKIDAHIIKLGQGGYLGNKGALAFRANIDDTSLVFLNCHLEAGEKNLK